MRFSSAIPKILAKKWTLNNNFGIQININNQKLRSHCGGNFGEDLNLHLISLQTPDFQNEPIEEFYANEYHLAQGGYALYRFSATFRDSDNLKYYRKFRKIYDFGLYNYFKDACFDVHLFKEPDYYVNDKNDTKKIMEINDCLIDGLSNLAISNDTENQILEFTVNFKAKTLQTD